MKKISNAVKGEAGRKRKDGRKQRVKREGVVEGVVTEKENQ